MTGPYRRRPLEGQAPTAGSGRARLTAPRRPCYTDAAGVLSSGGRDLDIDENEWGYLVVRPRSGSTEGEWDD